MPSTQRRVTSNGPLAHATFGTNPPSPWTLPDVVSLWCSIKNKSKALIPKMDPNYGLSPQDKPKPASPPPWMRVAFFAFIGGRLAMFKVQAAGDTFTAETLFASGELGGRSYATPVYHEGCIYGFRGDFLTCIDANTGRRKWKSRPPGGRGLIGIEDRLIVFGAEGAAVIVKATPEGYQEEERLHALKSTGYSWPSFASNSLYIRNLDSMARVEIGDRSKVKVDVSLRMAAQQEASHAQDLAAYRALPRTIVKNAGFDLESLRDLPRSGQGQAPLLDDDYVHLSLRG